ncbi:MAG TPA: hypothetical protein VGM49_02040 [Candidatus Limnocylindrales bacterium]|jgi:hypothetical protein
MLKQLEYLYTPSSDVAADAHYLVDIIGGHLDFAIDDGGTRVALVSLGDGPGILLTDHLEGDRSIHVYSVDDLAVATADLERRGWRQDRALELPPGPAVTFRTPGGLRFALYEATRPFVIDSFRGRADF